MLGLLLISLGSRPVAQGSHTFLLPKTSTINDVADHIANKVPSIKLGEAGGSGRIRIFDPQTGRKMKIFGGGEVIRDVQDTMELYAEVRAAPRGSPAGRSD
jgi:ubiquitin carboxyl-terminal hydrolase 7